MSYSQETDMMWHDVTDSFKGEGPSMEGHGMPGLPQAVVAARS